MAEGAGETRPLFKAFTSGASTRAYHGLVSSHRSFGGGMAHIYRLTILFLFFLSPASYAAFSPDSVTEYQGYDVWYSSAGAAGASFMGKKGAYATCSGTSIYPYAVTAVQGEGSASASYQHNWAYCNGSTLGFGQSSWIGLQSRNQLWCPTGATLSGGMCYCDAPNVEQNGTCVAPPPPNKCQELSGSPAGDYSGLGGLGQKTVCVQDSAATSSGDPAKPGCVLTGYAEFAYGQPYRWVAALKFTGGSCAPGTYETGGTDPNVPNSPTPDTSSCPPGKVPGTVNGTRICVDPGTSEPVSKKTTSTTSTPNTDGTTTQRETVTTTECGPAGCNNTTVTTTTVIPAGGGAGTSTSETTSGTCTRGSPGCSPDGGEDDPSRFGGACGSPFVCDGDAIMCAVALEQHQRNCALFVDSSPESILYESEKGKTGTQYGTETVTVGSGSFSQSNAIGGSAQCIADKTVTVWNQQVTLPFSQVCASLQYLGTVLVFVSFLLAYRIVSRG